MPPVFDRAYVHDAIDRLGIRPRRGLGQHFLADPDLLAWMADQAPLDENTAAVEIGAGLGQWTASIARRARVVRAFEIEPALAEEARRNLEPLGNVEVILADGRTFTDRLAPCPGPLVFFSNLPYATYRDLLVAALISPLPIRAYFFTIQSEVFDKLAAPAGSALYNGLGAVLGSFCTITRLKVIPCKAFVPEPRIASTYFRVDRTGAPPEPFDALLRHAEALFCWKKKRAHHAVESHLGPARLADAAARFGARLDARLRDWTPVEVVELARFC